MKLDSASADSIAAAVEPLGTWLSLLLKAHYVAVHVLMSAVMLTWRGPHERSDTSSIAAAVPLAMVWLGCAQAPLSESKPSDEMRQKLPTNWRSFFGSYWGLCALWLAFLVLPASVACYIAVVPLYIAWHLFARAFLPEELLLGRATFFLVCHVLAGLGLYRVAVHLSTLRLCLEVAALWMLGAMGITCGSHRLWSHRAYMAELPFRVVLMLMTTLANQGTIYHWSRDHRAHHKWTDTPADPHDTTRGFFYSHIGWLLLPKTEELKCKGKEIPCNDLLGDPVVAFQKWAEDKFFFMELISFGAPAVLGHVVYGDVLLGFLVHGMLRWVVTLHGTWCVNSVAHFFGDHSYDPKASPRENLFTSLVAAGEGWHSYHHKYPWDYAASEFGVHRQWNPSKFLIDLAVVLGQAHHLKRASHLAAAKRTAGLQQGD